MQKIIFYKHNRVIERTYIQEKKMMMTNYRTDGPEKEAGKMKKFNYSKIIVNLVIILNALFTAAALYAFIKTSAEPSTLIVAWFGFTTGELWMLASIKKKKVKEGGGKYESENTPADKE